MSNPDVDIGEPYPLLWSMHCPFSGCDNLKPDRCPPPKQRVVAPKQFLVWQLSYAGWRRGPALGEMNGIFVQAQWLEYLVAAVPV